MRIKTISVKNEDARQLMKFPNSHVSGRKHYGKDALLVRCGAYIYDVSLKPVLYYESAY